MLLSLQLWILNPYFLFTSFIVGSCVSKITQDPLNFANKFYFSNTEASYLIYDGIANELNSDNYNELGETIMCKGRYHLLKANID